MALPRAQPSRTALPALPLRLAAEPVARSALNSPSAVALAVHAPDGNDRTNDDGGVGDGGGGHRHPPHLGVAAIVDDGGIRAFALSSPASRRVLLEAVGLPPARQPPAAAARRDVVPEGASSRPPPALSSSDAVVVDADGRRRPSSDCRSPSSSEAWRNGPILCLVRTSPTSNDFEWALYRRSGDDDDDDELPTSLPSVARGTRLSAFRTSYHDRFVARLVTDSIRSYYVRQCLEPSVRGFLSVLEKQFARSDLYLFELLQNAVDDGATVVRLSIVDEGGRGRGGGGGGGRLRVSHDGRKFTPLDVLGLSSVGLSTKSREGKRTIGFMGVGFKAVYKRYSRVVIDDGTYSFAYERPRNDDNGTTTTHAGGYGWVTQPLWVDRRDEAPRREEEEEFDDGNGNDWCRFSLERPAGGIEAIRSDLSVLPPTAPPLLGRAALEKRERERGGPSGGGADGRDGGGGDDEGAPPSWTLDWDGKVHVVSRSDAIDLVGDGGGGDDDVGNDDGSSDRSEVVAVDVVGRRDRRSRRTTTRRDRWLFVSHRYVPGRGAADSYLRHAKRKHSGKEEISGFVRLDGRGGRADDGRRAPPPTTFRDATTSNGAGGGVVHSVLPTKLRLSIPMNVQGPFLLSVDRTDVQSFTDNDWNAELVRKIPMLIGNFFRWAAVNKGNGDDREERLRAAFRLLPPPETVSFSSSPSSSSSSASSSRDSSSSSPPLSADFLGQNVSLEDLKRVMREEAVLPVGVPPEKPRGDKTTSAAVGGDATMDVGDGGDPTSVLPSDDDFVDDGARAATMPTTATDCREGKHSVWVPPSCHRFLDADFLRGWLGKRPLRTDMMGFEIAFHPLFGSNRVVHQLTEGVVRDRKAQLCRELGLVGGEAIYRPARPERRTERDGVIPVGRCAVETTLRIMAAIGSALDELSNRGASDAGGGGDAGGDDAGGGRGNKAPPPPPPAFPSSVSSWPVFLTERGDLSTLDGVAVPGEGFADVPEDLYALLRPRFILEEEEEEEDARNRRRRWGGKGRKQGRGGEAVAIVAPKKKRSLLHPALEAAMVRRAAAAAADSSSDQRRDDDVPTNVAAFLSRARAESPSSFVCVADAISNLLKPHSELSALIQRSLDDFSFGVTIVCHVGSSPEAHFVKTMHLGERRTRGLFHRVGTARS